MELRNSLPGRAFLFKATKKNRNEEVGDANGRDSAHIQWNVSTLYVATGTPRTKAPPAYPMHSCSSPELCKADKVLSSVKSTFSLVNSPENTHTAT